MKSWRPPSISTFAILFIGAIVLLFGLVGRLTLERLEAARQQIANSNRVAAREELHRALGAVLAAARVDANSLAAWDESRQQLGNPTYYAYWREHRLRSSSILPGYVRDAELYDGTGKALGRTRTSSLPEELPEEWGAPSVIQDGAGPNLMLYVPAQQTEIGTFKGYVGLRVDLMDALLRINRFRYVNERSLVLDLPEGVSLAMREVPGTMDFKLVDTPETRRLEEAMRAGMRDLALLLGALSLAFYLMLMILLAFPLRRLSRHIDTLRTGGGGLRLAHFAHSLPVAELDKVRLSLNDYQARLDDVHRDLNRKNRELWDLAHVDALTGVYNRRAFDDDWQRTLDHLAQGSRRVEPISFMLVDCNHFKTINDTYGHQLGDEVIRLIAVSVQRELRPGDRLYRLGGDELAALLLDCEQDRAEGLARECAGAVSAANFKGLGIKEPVRVSIGIAHTLASAQGDLDDLQWQADAAMYAAKRPGHASIAVYRPNMAAAPKTLFSSMIANAVHEAITDGSGIQMYYQPIVELASGRVSHYEALLRIRSDDELIMPFGILSFVEARSLELELDRAVVRRVAMNLERGVIPLGTGLTVNLAGPTLLAGTILSDLAPLAAHLDRYEIALEVTETALITHIEIAGAVLGELRQRGFKVALDDFGSGYSSLRYLANMPIDLVKFDSTLVRGLESNTAQGGLVEDLIRLILKAGYEVVAEGVETELINRRITALGCRYGQGMLFGRPSAQCQPVNPRAPESPRLAGIMGGSGGGV